MPDQNRRRPQLALHVLRSGDEICHVGGEGRIGEIALALAQSGEVEAQDADARSGQRPADVNHRLVVLRAGEAMGE